MKKLMAILLATFTMTAMAREPITLAYSWTAADAAANFYRALADEANQSQNQYTFIFEAKPGAGGTIAANYTTSNPNGTVWLNGSAGFIRPNLFPSESHKMEDFQLAMPMCVQPALVISTKYKSFKEIPSDAKISIGMTGLGTTTHLITLQLAKNYPNLNIVPFKSTSEILISVLNGTLDLGIGFAGDSEQYTKPGAPRTIYWLGQTGQGGIKGVELLAKQGFSQDLLNMSPSHQIFASTKMSSERRTQIRKILVEASRTSTVRNAMAVDNCVPNNQMANNKIDAWYNYQVAEWKRLSQGIKMDR